MAYINLIDELTELDKKKIENYISVTGIHKNKFIGVDKWLEQWSHSNQKLYRFLGNKLIVKKDYSYEKPYLTIRREVLDKLFDLSFKKNYASFYWDFVRKNEAFTQEQIHFFNHLCDAENFVEDKISYGIKYKKDPTAKMLQVPSGTKPVKALQKIINYFNEWNWDKEAFEEFRLIHSMILNDKFVKGQMCLSIHPLDYITMSDNGSDWSSCMSWIEEGCYHSGTVEMMNSNNAICGYIISKKDTSNSEWNFVQSSRKKEEMRDCVGEEYCWNNKKWRELIYATKDIIMTGKSYPYYNETMSKNILEYARELAEKNINWTYTYGIEPYRDMVHIHTNNAMERNRTWVHYNGIKHNIIWDTKGMYNDMYNDHSFTYWCVRNKVKSNKMISVSGKCNCLRCNGSVITPSDDNMYNERYFNTGSVLCEPCRKDMYCEHCNYCKELDDFITVNNVNEINKVNEKERVLGYLVESKPRIRICKTCYDSFAKKCPCCDKPIWANDYAAVNRNKSLFYIRAKEILNLEKRFDPYSTSNYVVYHRGRSNALASESLYLCADCGKKLKEKGLFKQITILDNNYSRDKVKIEIINPEVADKELIEKLRFENLKSCSFEKKENVFAPMYISEAGQRVENKNISIDTYKDENIVYYYDNTASNF